MQVTGEKPAVNASDFIPFRRLLTCAFDAAGRPPASNLNQRHCMAPQFKGNPPKRKSTPQLPVLHPHAAGIDLGAREIYVAVPPGSDPRPVRAFPTFTEDLHALRDWLQACGVTSVAMESTGVYWIPLFQILAAAGIEVCLVNARHCKNLPGRKTDVQDCQWLQYLHSVGLLRGSFRPADQVWLSQSPSGGGRGCPAWDFQWYLPSPQVGQLYQLKMRALYVPLSDAGDETAVRSAVRQRVKRSGVRY